MFDFNKQKTFSDTAFNKKLSAVNFGHQMLKLRFWHMTRIFMFLVVRYIVHDNCNFWSTWTWAIPKSKTFACIKRA
jgi:hypothetical protein